jgi:hypothetical protein
VKHEPVELLVETSRALARTALELTATRQAAAISLAVAAEFINYRLQSELTVEEYAEFLKIREFMAGVLAKTTEKQHAKDAAVRS